MTLDWLATLQSPIAFGPLAGQGPSQAGMLLIYTAVHDHQDAVGFRPLDGFLVANPLLQPQVGDFEAHHVFDNLRDVLGSAKYVHQVDSSLRGIGGVEGPVSLLPESLGDPRVNRNDAIAFLLHVPGNVKSGTFGIIGKPQYGDGFGFLQ